MFPSSNKILKQKSISKIILFSTITLMLCSYVYSVKEFKHTIASQSLTTIPHEDQRGRNLLEEYPNVYEKVGQFDNNYGGTAINSFVIDDIAYVANDEEGLLILDVSDPTNPEFLSQCYDGSGWAWDIWVEGSYAYVADHLDGLEISWWILRRGSSTRCYSKRQYCFCSRFI